MIAALRAPRATALYIGPGILVAANVLPALLLFEALAPPSRHQVADLVGVLVSGALVAAAWACLVGVNRMARQAARRMFWEFWVPLLYGLGGYTAAFTVPDLARDLGRPDAARTGAPGPLEFLAVFAVAMVCAGVGLLLGRRAAATERPPQARARAVWVSDVDADPRWWLMQGVLALGGCLLLAVPYVLAASWADGLQLDAAVLGIVVVVAAWASRGHISITPWGVRAHYGHVPLLGWQVSADQIASVEVGQVRLLRSLAAWRCLDNLALRDGPALIVRTRAGRRHVVTLPQAEDAAVTLRTWIAERQTTS